jgi:hypothetical protein
MNGSEQEIGGEESRAQGECCCGHASRSFHSLAIQEKYSSRVTGRKVTGRSSRESKAYTERKAHQSSALAPVPGTPSRGRASGGQPPTTPGSPARAPRERSRASKLNVPSPSPRATACCACCRAPRYGARKPYFGMVLKSLSSVGSSGRRARNLFCEYESWASCDLLICLEDLGLAAPTELETSSCERSADQLLTLKVRRRAFPRLRAWSAPMRKRVNEDT